MKTTEKKPNILIVVSLLSFFGVLIAVHFFCRYYNVEISKKNESPEIFTSKEAYLEEEPSTYTPSCDSIYFTDYKTRDVIYKGEVVGTDEYVELSDFSEIKETDNYQILVASFNVAVALYEPVNMGKLYENPQLDIFYYNGENMSKTSIVYESDMQVKLEYWGLGIHIDKQNIYIYEDGEVIYQGNLP